MRPALFFFFFDFCKYISIGLQKSKKRWTAKRTCNYNMPSFMYLGVVAMSQKLTQHDVHKMEHKGKMQTEWCGLSLSAFCLHLSAKS